MAVVDSGFQTLPSHAHTNTTGDGGALNTTTLVNASDLFGMLYMLGKDSA